MTFELAFNDERRDLKHVFKKDLCDGAWHNVTLSISHSNMIIITVDGVCLLPDLSLSHY